MIDDTTINALFDQEAKLNHINFRCTAMRIASTTGGKAIKLINSFLCDLVRLYAVYFNIDGVRK